ncbi:lysosomal acid phosphatase isoform X2 [Lissotriton helveticus]
MTAADADGASGPERGLPGLRGLLLRALLLLSLAGAGGARELRRVTLLYRHGDRSPIKGYPTDPYNEDTWPQGFGQLTQVGMKQHWDLGQALRSRYRGFLNDSYDRREIHVRSTDSDRTLMSAECNLAGLYPPGESQTFSVNMSWQPIPVHTVPEDEDRLLKFPLLPCPRYEELQKETRQSAEYVNKTKENLSFLAMVANKTGIKEISLESVWSVYDTLFCESRHNLSLPSWATTEVMKRLEDLKNFSFRFLFGIHKTVEKSRLQGGLLLDQILKNFTEVAKSTKEEHLKVIMYSAHDTTVVALQAALNVYNGIQTPYAACHIMELYQEDSGNFSVEMYFRNDSAKDPFPLVLPGCSLSCPLHEFLRLTTAVISEDRERECRTPSSPSDTVVVGLAICGVVLFLVIAVLLVLVFRLRSQPDGYHQVSHEGEA